jgi:integrase
MATKKLTELMLDRVTPPARGQQDIWDALLPGFGLRVGARSKSFVVLYRFEGHKRRLTLGQYRQAEGAPGLTLGDARDAAREVLRKVAAGIDPAAAVEPPRPPEAPPIVRDVLATYVARKVKPNRRDAAEVERALKHDFERIFADRPIASITRRDINGMVEAIVDRGAAVHANRVLTMVKTFFRWAVEHEYVAVSPAAPITRPTRERPRERVLSADELARIWRGCDALGYPFGPLFQLLMLTAQRRDEVAEMRRGELDLPNARWTLPAARTKTEVEHQVHLSAPALAIIAALPGGADLLFTKTNETATSGWSRAKNRLDRLLMASGDIMGPPAPIPHWTLHDLRRSAATGMAELGVAPHVVDKILNHVQGTIKGVAAIYNRHPYAAERRDALDLWARHLLGRIELTSAVKLASGKQM